VVQRAKKSNTATKEYIDYQALLAAKLKLKPFEYVVVPNFVKLSHIKSVAKDFPEINSRGSFPLDSVKSGPEFSQLIKELKGEKFRKFVEDKFCVDLGGRPVMITARGRCENKDGQIHIDSKGKLVTVLVYMNEKWPHKGGRLRFLKNEHDMENYVEEVLPLAGTMIIFRCTDNAWHGHLPFEGQRKAIQLNWVVNDAYLNKERFRHKISAFFKQLKSLVKF
jgi:SM-20-related protein